jgi:hypothetical protein
VDFQHGTGLIALKDFFEEVLFDEWVVCVGLN